MRCLSQWMWRKGLRKHPHSLSAPSVLLVSPPIPHSSPAACRHAWSFPGQLCRRHLAGLCLWATFHHTHGTWGSLIPVGHIPSLLGRLVQPRDEMGALVHTSAAGSLSLFVDEEQDEGQAEDAHDAGTRGQCGSCDICNRTAQR